MKTHDYKIVNASFHRSPEVAANHWAEMGWRIVGAIADHRPGFANQLILERPVGVSHPDD